MCGELRCQRVNRDLPEICSRAPEEGGEGVGGEVGEAKCEERYEK